MASFSTWKIHADRGTLKRVHWVCGPERILVEEVLDTVRRYAAPADLDYMALRAGRVPDRDLWAAAFTYPATPGARRLLVVRDAEKISNWRPMKSWFERSRELPGVWIVFVSADDGFYDKSIKDEDSDDKLRPHVRVIKDASQGYIVRCAALSDDDAVAWLRARSSQMSDLVAQRVLVRVGGNLSAAAAVAKKASVFGGQLPEKVADALCQEASANDFSDDLLAMQKRAALLAAISVERGEIGRLLGLLDSRLDLMSKINAALRQRMFDARAVASSQDVKIFLVLKYRAAAKLYDPARVRSCRQALAVCDDAHRSGATQGVLQTLVALW